MKKVAFLSALVTFSFLSILSSCSDEAPVNNPSTDTPTIQQPDAYHDKVRTQPYPKADNELYLNPSPPHRASGHEDSGIAAIRPVT